MIYLEPTITVKGMDAREFALLLDRQPHFNLTLAQCDDLMCDLRKQMAAKVAYIQQIQTTLAFDQCGRSGEEDEFAIRQTTLFLEQQEQAVGRYRKAMTWLRKIREPLIALTELGWALEEQRFWGLSEDDAVEISRKREAKRAKQRAYDEPTQDEAFLP